MPEAEPKLKGRLMDLWYRWYLDNRDYAWIISELRRMNMPRISNPQWDRLKDYFREKEATTPEKMAVIRKRIKP